jgi:hypothetical protein
MPETQEQEWRRLTEAYGEMYDEQLLDLADSLNDLTETARTVLRDELRKRGLGDPLAPGWSAEGVRHADADQALDAAEGEAAGQPATYTYKVLLCECDETEQAVQIHTMLKRAGIDAWVQAPQGSYGIRTPRVSVAADQLDEARAVIANPIPQDIIDESRQEIPEYTPPVCPACGAADPILIAADPSNSWECESCGNEWSDPVVTPSEAQ